MENYEQKYKDLIAEIKERKNLISAEKDKANSMNEKLSLGGRVAILQELLAFANDTESEDEKIRKEILKYLEERKILELEVEPYHINEWIAWLEKQCEKMSDQRHGILDKLIEADDIYQMSVNDAMVEEAKNKAIEALSKLEISKLLGLEKQGEQKPTPKFKIGDTIHKIGENTVFPRTIEKIEDGDYVCNNSHSFVNIKFQDDYELVEQKPSWSEEDEKMLEDTISCLSAYQSPDISKGLCYQEQINWLKSLKNRVQPQQKQEWSEDDSWMLNVCCNAIDSYKEPVDKYLVKNWLKSLKPRWKPSEEQMEALNAINTVGELSYFEQGDLLVKLYQDLKKL